MNFLYEECDHCNIELVPIVKLKLHYSSVST
jgi:hypothetical protein